MFMKHYVPNRCEPIGEGLVRVDVNQELKMQKEKQGVRSRGCSGRGSQGGCEPRIGVEIIVKIQRK